ncbi:MAG: DUF3352 domain-containing protein [Opitutaceae bacterium]
MNVPCALSIAAGFAAVLLSTPARGEGRVDLTGVLPAETAVILRVRSVPEVREQWSHNPLAQTWAEPEVQDFFSPAIERFREEHDGGLTELIRSETGLTFSELLDLLPGEVLLAVLDLEQLLDEDAVEAPIVVLAELGEDTSKMESLLARLLDEDEQVREEEFQGETLRIVESLSDEDDGPTPSVTWSLVDRVLILGAAKAAVQQVIDNLKRGGATDSLAASSGFEAIRQESPDGQVSLMLNFQAIVPSIVSGLNRAEAERDSAGPSALAALGLTPEGLIQAFGLHHLTWAYGILEMGETSTRAVSGLKWTERPDLMRLLAYGAPPAPRPEYIPDTWVSVSTARFSLSDAYQGLKDILRNLSPALSALLEMRSAEINQALGIDIERDLIGNFGDQIVQAETLIEPGAEGASPSPTNQFFSVSIHDADTARRMIDAVMAMAPGLSEAITSREYLGETIYSLVPPSLPDMPRPSGFSYAITSRAIFFGVGNSSMVETAIQGLGGASNPIWSSPKVVEALSRLPSGESVIAYQDTKQMIVAVVNILIQAAGRFNRSDEEGEAEPLFDPSARPSAEIMSRHWGPMSSAIYFDPDGVRSVGYLIHGDPEEE